MRFYVYCESDEASVEPFILAEVVRDTASDRSLSLAAALAGPRAQILTRVELRDTPERRVALERWDARDDTMFEFENALLARPGRIGSKGRLHVVRDGDREPAKREMQVLPMDERLRQAILMSRGLRESTRQVIARARQLRFELGEHAGHRATATETVG